jgi:hypothetical protein
MVQAPSECASTAVQLTQLLAAPKDNTLCVDFVVRATEQAKRKHIPNKNKDGRFIVMFFCLCYSSRRDSFVSFIGSIGVVSFAGSETFPKDPRYNLVTTTDRLANHS